MQSSFGGWGGQQTPSAPWNQPGYPAGAPPRPTYGQQPYGQQPYGQQGFPHQQPYGPPPGQFGGHGWQQPTPPVKRPTGLLLALGLAGLVLLGLLAYAFLGSPTEGPGPQDPVGQEYQNEDYELPSVGDRVPELPIPSDSQIGTWLDDNKIYGQTLASPVRCELAPFDDVRRLSDAELEQRMTGYVECLTRVWGPSLKAAGFVDYQPKLTVYPAGSEINTRCGTQPSLNAFYCGADQNLYLASDVTRLLPSAQASERVVFDLIIAHEYGHAMQGRTGLFAASKIAAADASEAKAYEYSRRSEVQADSFAGLVVNSIGQDLGVNDADRAALLQISYEIGDDRLRERFDIKDKSPGDHGTGDNRRLWAERGLATSNIGACNTFTAPAGEVE